MCGKIKAAGHAGCMLCRCLYAHFPGNSIPGFLGKPCMTVPGMTTAGHGTDGPAAVGGNGSAHAVCSFSVSAFIICSPRPRVHCHFGQNADLFFPHPVSSSAASSAAAIRRLMPVPPPPPPASPAPGAAATPSLWDSAPRPGPPRGRSRYSAPGHIPTAPRSARWRST